MMDIQAAKKREKARQQKNVYKKRALVAEARIKEMLTKKCCQTRVSDAVLFQAGEAGTHLAETIKALAAERVAALEALEEAQGKLEAIQALTLEAGHAVVDHITCHTALHRILFKEGNE
jgi:hypothetical protein